MLTIENILFPTDFTPRAEDAFSHAAHLANRHDARIHVFNVVTPEEADQTNPMDYLPLEESGGALILTAEDVDVPGPPQADMNVEIVYRKMEGVSPAKEIVDYVGEYDIDLVVMGTHGRQGINRLLSGSVSEEVVRQSSCPVFTVLGRDDPQPGPDIQSVLAPVDFSESARLGLAHAREFAVAYGASLDVLHVVEEAVFPSVYGLDPITPYLPDVQERAREALERLTDDVVDGAVPTNLHVMTGYAARDLIDFADEHGTGLIAMATHGRTGLERFLIGSVAEKVIRSASCPVFTVKPFGKSLLSEPVPSSGADATP